MLVQRIKANQVIHIGGAKLFIRGYEAGGFIVVIDAPRTIEIHREGAKEKKPAATVAVGADSQAVEPAL